MCHISRPVSHYNSISSSVTLRSLLYFTRQTGLLLWRRLKKVSRFIGGSVYLHHHCTGRGVLFMCLKKKTTHSSVMVMMHLIRVVGEFAWIQSSITNTGKTKDLQQNSRTLHDSIRLNIIWTQILGTKLTHEEYLLTKIVDGQVMLKGPGISLTHM